MAFSTLFYLLNPQTQASLVTGDQYNGGIGGAPVPFQVSSISLATDSVIKITAKLFLAI